MEIGPKQNKIKKNQNPSKRPKKRQLGKILSFLPKLTIYTKASIFFSQETEPLQT